MSKSYLVLARKYRPADFDAVIGQEHITDLLKSAVESGRTAHAYLFCGPRGIGKTSCARILAKCLNCEKGPTVTPCGECASCRDIAKGTSFDVLEIDGASNRGIDEVRSLRENVKFAPSYGKYKIYIVDEVHMLTPEAFNALLKTLEEPPEHVIFIFATTDPNKVPATIISRCQRFDFKRIPLKAAVKALEAIAKREKIQIDQDALYAVSKAGQGSFRDSLSVLDQISAITSREIKGDDVYQMLGLVELDLLFELADALGQSDCAAALKTFDEIICRGKDLKQLNKDLIEHYRNLMIIKIGGKALGKLVDYPVPVKERYLAQTELYSVPQILKAIEVFIQAQEISRVTESLRTPIEIAFAKLTFSDGVPVPPPQPSAARSAQPTPAPAVKKNDKTAAPPAPAVEPPAGEEEPAALPSEDKPEPPPFNGSVDLENIRRSWSSLTYAVSREKMFLATYLQEGSPVRLADGTLVIGFPHEFEFHKETLESTDYIQLIEEIFRKQLKHDLRVKYVLVNESGEAEAPVDEDPEVKNVLESFGGKVISKWHEEK